MSVASGGGPDFRAIADVALQALPSLVARWLPDGKQKGHEWVARNPTRADHKLGSFSVNLNSGAWADFATDDKGGDVISLYAYLNGLKQGEAARALAQELAINDPGVIVDRFAGHHQGKFKDTPAQPPVVESAGRWRVLLPVPADAPPPPLAHIKRSKPEVQYAYRDASGALLGYICRFRTSDGGKEILPLVFVEDVKTGARQWRWLSFPIPRPLYGLDRLAQADPQLTVLIVEGEKCADAATQLGLQFVPVTWPGGSRAIGKVDWEPLRGRDVIIWPDCDAQRRPLTKAERERGVDPASKPYLPLREQPGIAAAQRIAEILIEKDCGVRIVNVPPPGEKPAGWDVADAIAEGWAAGKCFQFIMRNQRSPREAPAGEIEPPGLVAVLPQRPPHGEREPWRKLLIRNNDGKPIDCRENVYLILTYHPAWKEVIVLDEFANRVLKRKPLPWGGELGEWDSNDDFRLGLWLAQQQRLLVRNIGSITEGVHAAASDQRWHPVREYFNALVWDGTPRLDDWMSDCLGVPKTEYSVLVSRYFMIGMVARIFQPGCHMKYMLILEGPQDRGKSSAMRILGGEWFADTPFVVGEKDAYQMLRGKLLYEIAELDSFNRAETTKMKAFVSSPVDNYRASYERRNRDWPRQVIFVGTTNQSEYFKDATGNVRYWPIVVGQIDFDTLAGMRDQLFAEAVLAFHEGARWQPDAEQQRRLFEPEQEVREINDPWLDLIGAWLDKSTRQTMTVAEVLLECLKVEAGKIDGARQMAMRIGLCMRKLGWLKRRPQRDGVRFYHYERPTQARTPASPYSQS